MMRSATDFLPASISTFTNLDTSTLPNLGSGRISRFGTSLRRGILITSQIRLLLSSLGALRAVLGTGLLAILDALGVKRTANDVITHTRQVLNAATTDQH